MNDEKIILSERPEDLRKAVEWGREQQKKILDAKGERISEDLMKKMTPRIVERDKK